MKSTISILTALAFLSIVGCNTPSYKDKQSEEETSYSSSNATEDQSLTEIDERSDLMTAGSEEKTTEATQQLGETEEATYTETEVVEVDTVATNIAYDVNRRTIEQVDTVGATKTYEVTRRIVKKKILVDTIVETVSKQQQVEFEKGDYQVLNEKVVKDTVNERIDHTTTPSPEERQRSASESVEEVDSLAQNTLNSMKAPEMKSKESLVQEIDTVSVLKEENQSNEAEPASEAQENTERRSPSYEPVQSDTTKTDQKNS